MTTYNPGDRAEWRDPDTGLWHPVMVLFQCCQASSDDMYNVVDEYGYGHLAHADRGELRPLPRLIGPPDTEQDLPY